MVRNLLGVGVPWLKRKVKTCLGKVTKADVDEVEGVSKLQLEANLVTCRCFSSRTLRPLILCIPSL